MRLKEKRNPRYKIILIFFILIYSIPTFAGRIQGPAGSIEQRIELLTKEEQKLLKQLANSEIDEKVRNAYNELVVARINHELKALKEKQSVILWSNRACLLIFVIVHILLVIGIWVAFKEFHNANKLRKENPEQHEINLSIEGIALKTSLHGTMLLCICIFLYFLFLKYVLPINVV